MTTVFDGEIEVRNGSWRVACDAGAGSAAFDVPFANQVNGLLDASLTGVLAAWTGTQRGRVPVRIEVLDAAPALEPADDDVVDVSWTPPGDHVVVLDGRGGTIAEVAIVRPGPYRIRYRIAGLDAARERLIRRADDPVVDRCWLQLWPAPWSPDVVVQVAGRTAAAWHEAVRGAPHVTTEREREESIRREDERRRAELAEENRRMELDHWGGRLPGSRITDIPDQTYGLGVLARADRELLDAVEALPDEQSRAAALRLAATLADLTGLSDELPSVTDALTDLAEGLPPRTPFGSTTEAYAACGGPPVPSAGPDAAGVTPVPVVAGTALIARRSKWVSPTPRQHVAMAVAELGSATTGFGALCHLVSRVGQVIDPATLAALVREQLPGR